MRMLLEYRGAFNLAVAAVVGTLGQRAWPFPADNVFLAVIDARKPWLFDGLAYVYATLWFSTPRFFAAYREWLRAGDPALGRLVSPAFSDAWRAGTAAVETLVLPYVYADLSALVQTA